MASNLKPIFITSLAGLSLVSCAQATQQDDFTKLLDATGKWVMTEDEKPKYAKYKVNEARSRFVNDRFQSEIKTLQTEPERQALAAAIYMNFAMLQSRAIPAYCLEMNVDISAFQTAYLQTNSREEAGLAKILAAQGVNYDDIWGRYSKRLHTTAKYELMSSGSSYSACKTVKDDPDKMARITKFSGFYPKVSAYLKP